MSKSQKSANFSGLSNSNTRHSHLINQNDIESSQCHIDDLSLPFVEIDLENACIIKTNESFCQITGFSRRELLEENNLNKLFFFDLSALKIFLGQATAEGAGRTTLPVDIRTKSGEVLVCQICLRVIFNNRAPFRLTGLVLNTGSHQSSETESLRLKAAIRGSNEAVGMADDQGRHFYHNEAFTRMFGYEVDDLSDQHPGILYCNQNQAREVFEVMKNGHSWAGEVEMRTKAGKTLHVALHAEGIKNSEGRLIAFIGHHTDITENKQTVKLLAQSEERYKDFIENAPIGMLITNLDGNVTYANRKMEEITGYDRKDWINTSFFPLVFPEDLPVLNEQRNSAIKNQENVKPYELRVVHVTGEIRWLRTIPRLIFSEEPSRPRQIIGFQNFLEDITPTKLAIEEKTRLEKQLVQSQKMEAIGTMAGGIAHDFNNILYPIMGYAELLKDDLDPDSIPYSNVVEIEKSAHRAKDLVQQILSFSRPLESEIVPVAMQAALDDVLSMVRAVFPSSIQIKKFISRNCRMILADPTQVHQVLLNLCTNAYHAMLDKGGTLYISLEEEKIDAETPKADLPLEPGVYARLTIRDTGCGIPKKVLDRIFEPYFTTKVAGEGTGLGLATVLAIVEKMNGHIKVESEPGQGSAFYVYFPILPLTLNTTQEKSNAPVPKGHESIMIVDDEESILNMLAQLLHRLGYRVTCFLDSQKALYAFSQSPENFDVVITDLTMPNMTGVDLAQRLTRIAPSLPIILCTGFPERVVCSELEKNGIKALLGKPAVFRELGNKIREVLSAESK